MEIQERIVAKSHELFMRYGIRSVSMDEIASQLGISKKTIYQYYADKDAVVDAVVDIEIRENEKECACFKEASANAVHEVFLAMDKVQEMLKAMDPSILYDLQKYHPKAFQKFNEHKQGFFFEVNRNNIIRGIEEELYRSDVDANIIARYRIACVFLIFDQTIYPKGKFNITDVLWQTTEHYLYGLATAKGIKLINKYKEQRGKK